MSVKESAKLVNGGVGEGGEGGQREPPVVKQVRVVVSQGQMVVIVSGVEMRVDKADLGRQRDGGLGPQQKAIRNYSASNGPRVRHPLPTNWPTSKDGLA